AGCTDISWTPHRTTRDRGERWMLLLDLLVCLADAEHWMQPASQPARLGWMDPWTLSRRPLRAPSRLSRAWAACAG
ncbi:hypothetical protein BC831DRAFT_471623, partial [Entophlyctis helioformis]